MTIVIHTTIMKNSSEHGPMHWGRWVMRTGMNTVLIKYPCWIFKIKCDWLLVSLLVRKLMWIKRLSDDYLRSIYTVAISLIQKGWSRILVHVALMCDPLALRSFACAISRLRLSILKILRAISSGVWFIFLLSMGSGTDCWLLQAQGCTVLLGQRSEWGWKRIKKVCEDYGETGRQCKSNQVGLARPKEESAIESAKFWFGRLW